MRTEVSPQKGSEQACLTQKLKETRNTIAMRKVSSEMKNLINYFIPIVQGLCSVRQAYKEQVLTNNGNIRLSQLDHNTLIFWANEKLNNNKPLQWYLATLWFEYGYHKNIDPLRVYGEPECKGTHEARQKALEAKREFQVILKGEIQNLVNANIINSEQDFLLLLSEVLSHYSLWNFSYREKFDPRATIEKDCPGLRNQND